MSLKFDDRIAKTYRREKYNSILESVLARSTNMAKVIKKPIVDKKAFYQDAADAAIRNGKLSNADESSDNSVTNSSKTDEAMADPESAVSFILERLSIEGVGLPSATSRAFSLVQSLVSLLNAQQVKLTAPTMIATIDSIQHAIPFSYSALFWQTSADLYTPVPFQIHFSTPALANHPSDLIFESLYVHFSDQRPPLQITHQTSLEIPSSIDIGFVSSSSGKAQKEVKANLSFANGDKVINGILTSSVAHNLQISKIVLALRVSMSVVMLNIHSSPSKTGQRWYTPNTSTGKNEIYLLSEIEDRSECRYEVHCHRIRHSLICRVSYDL